MDNVKENDVSQTELLEKDTFRKLFRDIGQDIT